MVLTESLLNKIAQWKIACVIQMILFLLCVALLFTSEHSRWQWLAFRASVGNPFDDNCWSAAANARWLQHGAEETTWEQQHQRPAAAEAEQRQKVEETRVSEKSAGAEGEAEEDPGRKGGGARQASEVCLRLELLVLPAAPVRDDHRRLRGHGKGNFQRWSRVRERHISTTFHFWNQKAWFRKKILLVLLVHFWV